MTIKEILNGIEPIDPEWMTKAQDHTAQLVMPPRALGRLHDVSERLCGIQRTLEPSIAKKAVLVMAGDHGIVAEGISAFPQEVTGAMVQTFLAGGAGINAIARHIGAEVWVVDVGIIPELDPAAMPNKDRFLVRKIGNGTANFATGPAMTLGEAEKSIQVGFEKAAELFKDGVEILGTGDMGIGNTTPSAAVGIVLTGKGLDDMVGRGTGVDDDGLNRKKEAIRRGLALNNPDGGNGLDVLSKVGGFEIGAIAGSILAAAFCRRPVVIDGFISTAGALIANALCPTATGFMFAGHCSEEPGHRHMLQHLGLKPLLDLGMRLGEGTGGTLAMGVMEAALKIFCEVMTFSEAGVPDK